ncbi:MAG TPA: sialidase family protein [Candidatus Thermoplasmatota archaeon]|nr:sialidase family protein [Candidatus Thermoplasmatota archaeon]
MRAPLVIAALLLAGCVNVADPGGGEGAPVALAGYERVCDLARGSAGWTEPCLAFASPNESPSKTEVDLAVNPTDPENVVVGSKDNDPKASPCVWAVPQVSKDGGRSWTTVYIGGEMGARQPTEPLWGWNCITDPIMAFDAQGTLYYSLQAYDHTVEAGELPRLPGIGGVFAVGSAIFAARSTDGGLTWDKVVPLHVGDGANVFHDYMRVLVNPATGTYHTIWNQFTGPATVVPVLVAWDGASDAPRPPTYVPVPDRPEGTVMAGFAASASGTLYVLLEDGDDAWLTVSTDDGRTFSAPRLVEELRGARIERQALGDDAFRTTGSYELVVDNTGGPRDGWLYATISACEARLDCDVFVSRSEDGGGTWTEQVLVNGGAHKPNLQWIPRPHVDRLGNLHVLYFDTSRQGGTSIDATWAVSTDAGATWNSTYLTATPFDGNLGIHQDGFPFIGDYNGIGGAGDFVYMAFPTTVTGRAEIAVAKVRLPAS